MTNSSQPEVKVDIFALDPLKLTQQAVKGLRMAFAISGAVALILGIVLLFWPTKTLAVIAIFLGINFLIAGGVRVALGIFSHGLSTGLRILDVVLGLLVLVAGIIILRNSTASGEALLLFTVVFMGIGWIIEGIVSIAEAGRGSTRTWAIVFGILSVLAGIVVLVVPVWTAQWLLLMSGIMLIILGIVGLVRAFTFGKSILVAS